MENVFTLRLVLSRKHFWHGWLLEVCFLLQDNFFSFKSHHLETLAEYNLQQLLNEFSSAGDYVLIDAAAREALLKEITYQHDGMVSANEAKSIGKQAGADLLIFGAVRMKPKSRGGKTIKQYSINIRMTDLERGIEVLRVRTKINKFSKKSSVGW